MLDIASVELNPEPELPVEITAAMLDAGMAAYFDWDEDPSRSKNPYPPQRAAYLVTTIFVAMTRSAERTIPPTE